MDNGPAAGGAPAVSLLCAPRGPASWQGHCARPPAPRPAPTTPTLTPARGAPLQVWRPGIDPVAEGEELDYDPTAYDCLHRFALEWPCLSFDLLRDGLGAPRAAFPHTVFMVAGTQAAQPRANHIAVLKLAALGQGRHGKRDKAAGDDSDSSSSSGGEESEGEDGSSDGMNASDDDDDREPPPRMHHRRAVARPACCPLLCGARARAPAAHERAEGAATAAPAAAARPDVLGCPPADPARPAPTDPTPQAHLPEQRHQPPARHAAAARRDRVVARQPPGAHHRRDRAAGGARCRGGAAAGAAAKGHGERPSGPCAPRCLRPAPFGRAVVLAFCVCV
jgi:hypothetical protein